MNQGISESSVYLLKSSWPPQGPGITLPTSQCHVSVTGWVREGITLAVTVHLDLQGEFKAQLSLAPNQLLM